MKQAESAGYIIVYDREEADSDIVVINTCGFINDAKEESVDTIVRYASARERGDIESLYVMGCLSERYMDDLKQEIPEVDTYFGVNDIEGILRSLGSEFRKDIFPQRVLTGPGYYAYLKISEGCDRTCAFCAIPGIRGKYTSRSIEELVEESKILASRGVKELIMIAQDLSYYGLDLYGRQSIVQLARELSLIDGIEWIRLHYLYPANFPLGILDLMKENRKICRYIDLPIQHIAQVVLEKMRRSHGAQDTRELLKKIRDILPDAAIRTTIITGHPGEGEAEFRELKEFISEFKFDRLGVFKYSHEEDTYGYLNYSDDIPDRVKQKRADEIMSLQQQISASLNENARGLVREVIIDRREGIYYIARSRFDSPDVDQEVLIPANNNSFNPGDIIMVNITGSTEFDLIGEIA